MVVTCLIQLIKGKNPFEAQPARGKNSLDIIEAVHQWQ